MVELDLQQLKLMDRETNLTVEDYIQQRYGLHLKKHNSNDYIEYVNGRSVGERYHPGERMIFDEVTKTMWLPDQGKVIRLSNT